MTRTPTPPSTRSLPAGGGRLSQRLEADLRRRIASGEWQPGAMLPGRHDLALDYGVALNTLQRAIGALIADGTLQADPRRGTYVARAGSVPTPAAVDGSTRGAQLAVITLADPAEIGGDQATFANVALRALERAFAGDGRRVAVHAVWHRRDLRSVTDEALATGPQSVVIANPYDMPDWAGPAQELLRPLAVPSLLLWGAALNTPLPHLYYDQWMAGHVAARHLAESGYRRVLLAAPYAAGWLDQRHAGARDALRELGLEVVAAATTTKRDAVGFGRLPERQRRELLARAVAPAFDGLDQPGRDPIAILAPSDHEALLLLDLLRDRGAAPGRDVGLIGFDDSDLGRLRGLSSVRPPMEEMGELAARLLLRALQGEALPISTRLSPLVMVRASTRR